MSSKIEHCLTEQKCVAELLCQKFTHQVSFENQIEIITALIALGWVQEVSYKQNCTHNHLWEIKKNTTSELEPASMICSSTQCFFCYKQLSYSCKVCEHMERHFIFYQLDDPISCSHSVCQNNEVILDGYMHFKYHAATSHNLSLSKKCEQ